jgi:hypothetical protein
MSAVDHLFIPRHELDALSALLREIPGLMADLSVSVRRQDRIGLRGEAKKPKRPSEQPLPYRVDAVDAGDELHNELGTWVRIVCEYRGIEQRPRDTTAALARWLDKNLIALGMTEGTENALEAVGKAVDRVQWIVCPPEPVRHIDQQRLESARKLRLNARGIATLASELGDEYRHLSKRRVLYLKEREWIKQVPGPWRKDWVLFLVGDVMDAHLAHPIRDERAVSA